jgi:hypothetical protein
MMTSARGGRVQDVLSVAYSSSSIRFNDANFARDALFLRNVVSADGECSRVVEVASDGFQRLSASFGCIPRIMKVISANCFQFSAIRYLAFEFSGGFGTSDCCERATGSDSSVRSGSRDGGRALLRISQMSFASCRELRSVSLPSHLVAVAVKAFSQCPGLIFFRAASPSHLQRLEGWTVANCAFLQVVVVPSSVRVLDRSPFHNCAALSVVIFGENSELRRIESHTFVGCLVARIFLPGLVEKVSGLAFTRSGIVEIEVAADNRHFRVSGGFLLSFDGKSVVIYFGRSGLVRIPAEVETICSYAFAISRSVEEVEFGANSRLRLIGRGAF